MGRPSEYSLDDDGRWEYWVRWQVPVCALIFLIPTAVSISFIIKRGGGRSSAADLWMPCWRNLSPLWLLLYRAFALISMSCLLYQTVLTFGHFVFYFYTQWTFTLVIFYFTLGTIISARGYWKYWKKPFIPIEDRDKLVKKDSDMTLTFKGKETNHSQMQFDQRAGFWENLMQNVYQACAGAVMLTDIVFWCLLLPFQSGDNFTLTLLIGFMHSLNAVFLLLDSALNSLPFPWYGLTYFVLWSASYIIFQWGLHAYGFTWWPYPFLELATPWAPLWYFGLALVHLPCYGLYVLLVKAKVSVLSRMFPNAFIRVEAGKKQIKSCVLKKTLAGGDD